MERDPSRAVARDQLRRRLTALVYRDAARAYGVGMAGVILPLVYLFREWPPWEIRAALHDLAPLRRAELLALAHALYGLASLPLVRVLLASERLRWWWTLPLPATWWRALHLRHLLLLNGPWLLAIGYGLVPLVGREGMAEAITSGVAFVAVTLAGQVVLAAVIDRGIGAAAIVLAGWAATVVLAVMSPGAVGAALGGLLLLGVIRRLGTPLPEPRARMRGHSGGHPILALARLGWLAVRRRDAVPIAWGLAVELLAVGLAGLGLVHVGAEEPGVAASMLRGIAVASAALGAGLVLRAIRAVDGDRPLLDTWGLQARDERRAHLLLAALGGLPAAIGGSLVLPWLAVVGRLWPLEAGLAVAWAAIGTTRFAYLEAARRRLDEPRSVRLLLRGALGALLAVTAETGLALVPWALYEAWRLPAAQRQAHRTRQRFETAQRDDHRS